MKRIHFGAPRGLVGTVLGILLAVCGVSGLWATEGGGERPAAYLDLGLGGKETALGGAAAALSGDVTAMFHNPAGLTGVRTLELYSQYAFLTQGRTLGVLAVGNRLERSPLSYGVAWVYFSGGNDLEYRLGPSLDPMSLFSDTEMTFALAAGYRLNPKWQVGITGKMFLHTLSGSVGWGAGFDLGLMFRPSPLLALGLVATNPYSRLGFQNAPSEPFPPGVRLGATRSFGKSWNGFLEGEYESDLKFRPKVGLEYQPASGVSIRAGYGDKIVRLGFAVLAHGKKVAESFEYVVQQDRIQHGVLNQIILQVRFL